MLRDVPAFDPLLVLAHDPEPTLVVDARARGEAPSWIVLAASDAYLARTGLARDAVVGAPYPDVVRALEGHTAADATARVLARVAGGDEPAAEAARAYTLVRDAEGRVVAILCRPTSRASSVPPPPGRRTLRELGALFGDAPVLVALLSGDRHVVEFANATVRDLWGVASEGDVLGRSVFDVVPDLRGQGFDEILANVRDTGVPFHGREVHVRFDRPPRPGERRRTSDRWFDFVYQAVRDAQGRPHAVLVAGVEVTDRVVLRERAARADRALAGDRSALLRRVTDAAVVGTWSLDGTSREIVADDGVVTGLGLPRGAAFGLDVLLDAVDPEDRDAVREALEGALDVGAPTADEPRVLEARVHPTDAAPRWVELRLVRADDGPRPRLVGTVADIDDRKEAELERERLHALERRAHAAASAANLRLQALFEQAPVAVSVVRGADLVYEVANPRYEAMVGRAGLVGRPLREAFPELPDDAPIFELLRSVWRSGGSHTANEYPLALRLTPDGPLEDRTFHFSVQAVRDAGGAVDALLTVALDVTELVSLRRDVEDLARREASARQQAEVANRLKDEFLATISHELRTPLTSILGWSAMLRDDAEASAPGVRKAVEIVHRNAQAQSAMVEELLDVARIVRGEMRLDLRPVVVADVARAAVDAARTVARAKGVELVFEDAASHGSRLLGDPERLRQALGNLLSNAVKFTPPGGRVVVESRSPDGFVDVVVRDSGTGIAADFLPFVFDRFRQADGSATRRAGGLGLGLSIARHLVEAHGGTVAAESEGEGLGATFSVRLPVRPFTEPEAGAPGKARADRARRLAGVRVLVVEDQDDARELVELVLSSRGATVRAESSADDALEALGAFEPHVLVSDISMPGRDGYWLVREAKAQRPALPAIALTALAARDDARRAREAGFDRHLAKPVEADRLVDAIEGLRA